MKMSYSVLALLLAGMVFASGCTTSNEPAARPLSADFLAYSNPTYGIQMQYPASWTVNENAEGIVVAFVSPLEDKNDIFRDSVNVVMNDLSEQKLTMEDYTEFALQQLARTFPDALITEANDITLDGNPARKIVYTFQGQYGKLQVMQAWTIKDDLAYVITYTAQEEKFSAYRGTAEKMAASFKIITNILQQQTQPQQKTITTANTELVGGWRAYSEVIYYDSGSSNYLDTASTRVLELRSDGTWEFGSSKGTWKVEPITDTDWERWATPSYGPTKKIILNGWNNDIGDGPIESSETRVDFFWIIYRAEPPTVSQSGQVQIKFGHTINS
ncbi:MAG: DcrB-related protein [Candidatus Aenigmarchaeota archaeon]|nr:DcrB-related protein [Candidatus Aenigmarchaeota archaeon]